MDFHPISLSERLGAHRMDKKHVMKGTKTLSLSYLLFGGVGIFVVGFLLYFSLTRVLLNVSISSAEATLIQSGKYLEVYIERLKTMSSLVSQNADVRDYFNNETEFTGEQYQKRIQDFIHTAIESDKTIKSIILISKEGKIVSNEEGLTMSMSEDMMQEAWYVNAIHQDMPILTSARMQSFSMDKNLWVISLSEEIVDEDGNNIGVAVIDIPYTSIENYLSELHLGENGYAFILNENQEVVFHKDFAYYTDQSLVQSLIELKNQRNTLLSDDTLISQYQIQNSDWTLVGVCKVDSLPVIRKQIIETILFGFAIILGGVMFTTALLRKLAMKLSMKEQEIHDQQMMALYSQINPHFLYNTLDTIVWMAEFNQSEDVIKITKSLAQFFRLSLNQGNNVTTLGDEIEHVKQYLYIQKQRYQDKLNYSFKIDETLLDIMVPKIILQPIVENCIYHGIQELEGPGMIQITCKKSEDSDKDFQIEIMDNGVGFDFEDGLQHLPKTKKTRLGGVGLENVQERIQLLCGKQYGINVKSSIGKGTIVTLFLCK